MDRVNFSKTWPFKFQCMWEHGLVPGMTVVAPGFINLLLPDFCTWLRLPNHRVREHIQECARLGMIKDLKLTRGIASFRLVPPPNLGAAT